MAACDFSLELLSKRNSTRKFRQIRTASIMIVRRCEVVSVTSFHRPTFDRIEQSQGMWALLKGHLTGNAYRAQYDEECAEVETYRQKQVFNSFLSPFRRY